MGIDSKSASQNVSPSRTNTYRQFRRESTGENEINSKQNSKMSRSKQSKTQIEKKKTLLEKVENKELWQKGEI